MPLYTQNGKLLNKTGTLGTSVGCCCDDPPPSVSNCCSGAAVTVARSVTVTITLGTNLGSFNPTSCSTAQAEAVINGTYVLPFDAAASGYAIYKTTLSNGTEIGISWYCTGLNYFGSLVSIALSFRFCDVSLSCFDRSNWDFLFDAPGYSVFGVSAPTLCSITQGDTSSFSGEILNNINLDDGLTSCSQNSGYSFDRYKVTVSVTPSW
jgi:hypothetical protein